MEFKDALGLASRQYREKLPFVLFSEPGSSKARLVLGKILTDQEAMDNEACGFVFAPFLKSESTHIIHAESSELLDVDLPDTSAQNDATDLDITSGDREEHIEKVNRAIQHISSGNVRKIVMSRRVEIKLKGLDIKKLGRSLFGLYPDAFRYIWYHPQTDLWCGASPELLLQTRAKEFMTMALAGTQLQRSHRPARWQRKEREEQQLVVDGIVDNLENITSFMKVSRPYSVQAANLLHIRTDIQGMLKKSKKGWQPAAKALHPTPAVCGLPPKAARKFILKNEAYPREYYTGYMGWADYMDRETRLYVNLRCMKVQDSKAFLYAGGGITADSVAEQEWEETENKLKTMMQVLAPIV